jgi:hypothetical protein
MGRSVAETKAVGFFWSKMICYLKLDRSFDFDSGGPVWFKPHLKAPALSSEKQRYKYLREGL